MRISDDEIRGRIDKLWEMASPCRLCPRACGARRKEGEIGFCGAGWKYKLASWAVHRGEEPPISGVRGSGTIFSSHCTMKCLYCQNFPFSQLGNGKEVEVSELADFYIELMNKGVHNLNFVTPTHYSPHLFEAWYLARQKISELPIVYNTSGYERTEILAILDGMVDIYLPDIRYSNNLISKALSQTSDYVEVNRAAIKEMARQVGPLTVDENEIGIKGLIVRHLVLPNDSSGTRESLSWLSREIGTWMHISLMCQYFPTYKATELEGLKRPISNEEYSKALEILEECGFENAWAQDPEETGGA
ncbi:MAG: radical SAM protein [Candidatus Riflebacteria bacterium]|nr:radical SAM protein [Candidatus Riflebacteria bacterium]